MYTRSRLQLRSLKTLVLGVLAVLPLIACQRSTTQTIEHAFAKVSYWNGLLEVSDMAWRVGIEPRPGTKPLIDATSLWRSRQQAASYRVLDDGSLEIGLPESLGLLVIERLDGDRIFGSVHREDGAKGSFRGSPGQRVSPEVTDMEINSDGASIAASLMKPPGEGPFSAVIIIHGSGDSDRSVPPYRFLGDYFVQHGLAVLTYDKRGCGASTGDWRKVGFEPRAEDVRAMVDRLTTFEWIRKDSIGLMGVSQGVWVAGLAARDNPDVSFMISVSGAAVPPAVTDGFAGWVQSRRAGLSVREADERRELVSFYLDAIRDPESDAAWERFIAMFEEAKRKAWFKERPLDPGPREELAQGWYPLMMDHDPLPALEATNIPVLWLYGENDTQLDARESVAILSKLKESGKDYEIHLFPDAGHGIAVPMSAAWESAQYTAPAPGFFEAIDRFIGERIESASP